MVLRFKQQNNKIFIETHNLRFPHVALEYKSREQAQPDYENH